MENCVFCQIVARRLPAKIVYEDEHVLGFYDIQPAAPIHVLLVPKQHIATVNEVEAKDAQMMGHLFLAAAEVARRLELEERGYRLIVNVGKDGRQDIMHIHMHLMGGMRLPAPIYWRPKDQRSR